MLALLGCGEEDAKTPLVEGGQGGSSAGSGGDGGSSAAGSSAAGSNAGGTSAGGSDAGAAGSTAAGAAGEGGSAGEGGAAGSGTAGDGGGAGEAGAAGAGGAAVPQALIGCAKEAAFGARSVAFSVPTAKPVATLLNTLFYDPVDYTFVAALSGLDDPETAKIAFSSPAPAEGPPGFPGDKKPATALLAYPSGGAQTSEPQPTAYLRLIDEDKTEIYLKMIQIRVDLLINAPCSEATVTMSALIPESEGNIPIAANGQKKTLLEIQPLENPGGQGKAEGWQLQATFQTSSIEFNFSTFP